MREQLNIALKWLMSFTKSEWQLRDYPIKFHKITIEDQVFDLFGDGPYLWSATINNFSHAWGGGFTKEEAYIDLKRNLERFVARNVTLPRPGHRVGDFEFRLPLSPAPEENLRPFMDLQIEFLKSMFGVSLEDYPLIDATSLFDFVVDDNRADLVASMEEIFGVNIAYITSGNLVRIFKEIERHRISTGIHPVQSQAIKPKFKVESGQFYTDESSESPVSQGQLEYDAAEPRRALLIIQIEFIESVLERSVEEVQLNNTTSLFDFDEGDRNAELLAKMEEVFGIDVSDIIGGNLFRMFEKIDRTRS